MVSEIMIGVLKDIVYRSRGITEEDHRHITTTNMYSKPFQNIIFLASNAVSITGRGAPGGVCYKGGLTLKSKTLDLTTWQSPLLLAASRVSSSLYAIWNMMQWMWSVVGVSYNVSVPVQFNLTQLVLRGLPTCAPCGLRAGFSW